MKMLIAAVLGGAVLGFVDVKLLAGHVDGLVADPGVQAVATAAVAAFLGVIWGWVAKGVIGGRPKE